MQNNQTSATNPYADEGLLAKLASLLSPNSAEAFYAGPNAQEWNANTQRFIGKYDQKPRFEIDDSSAKVSIPHAADGGTAILGEVLDHKDLYKNYPYFADIPVEFVKDYGSKGSFDGHKIRIKAELPDEEKKNVLFHEVQHTIQDYEGFARGGSLMSKLVNDSNLRLYKKFAEQELQAHIKALKEPYTNPYSNKTTYIAPKSLVDYNPFHIMSTASKNSNSWEYTHMPYDMESEKELLARVDRLKSRIGQADKLLEQYRVSGSPSIDEAYDFYKNLSGEIEARDVAARSAYLPEQRKSISPYSSENIPVGDAFTIYTY